MRGRLTRRTCDTVQRMFKRGSSAYLLLPEWRNPRVVLDNLGTGVIAQPKAGKSPLNTVRENQAPRDKPSAENEFCAAATT